jgi:cytochrome c oxidase cbb3-type subunit 4
METYTLLRAFADSWFLIVLFGFFVGVWVFAFLPGLQGARDEAASIPFRDERTKCSGSCEACRARFDFTKGLDNG